MIRPCAWELSTIANSIWKILQCKQHQMSIFACWIKAWDLENLFSPGIILHLSYINCILSQFFIIHFTNFFIYPEEKIIWQKLYLPDKRSLYTKRRTFYLLNKNSSKWVKCLIKMFVLIKNYLKYFVHFFIEKNVQKKINFYMIDYVTLR